MRITVHTIAQIKKDSKQTFQEVVLNLVVDAHISNEQNQRATRTSTLDGGKFLPGRDYPLLVLDCAERSLGDQISLFSSM
jgi:hypothetical protein